MKKARESKNINCIYLTDDLYKFSTLEEALKHAKNNEDCTKITKREIFNEKRDSLKESVVWEKGKKSLTERKWNYVLKAGVELRQAIADEDIEGIRIALMKCYDELFDNRLIDEYDYEDWREEVEYADFEDEYGDYDEDAVDYELDQLYDLCDNIGVFVALEEALERGNEEEAKILQADQDKLYDDAEYCDDHNQPEKAVELRHEANKLQKKINESQAQEISDYYDKFSKRYGVDLEELVYGDDGFMNSCYPNNFPDFNGDVIFSRKYWKEFEKWLKDTKGIELPDETVKVGAKYRNDNGDATIKVLEFNPEKDEIVWERTFKWSNGESDTRKYSGTLDDFNLFKSGSYATNDGIDESKKSKKKKDKVRFVGDMNKEISFFNNAMGNNASADGSVGSVAVAESKELKEYIDEYEDDFDYCKEDVADALEAGWWHGQTRSGRNWGLTIDGNGGSFTSPRFADFLTREIAYPVRDGYFNFIGLDLIIPDSIKDEFDGDEEVLRKDLEIIGCDDEDIDEFLNGEIEELETWIDFDIDIDDEPYDLDPLGLGLSVDDIYSYQSEYNKGHIDIEDIMNDGYTEEEAHQILDYDELKESLKENVDELSAKSVAEYVKQCLDEHKDTVETDEINVEDGEYTKYIIPYKFTQDVIDSITYPNWKEAVEEMSCYFEVKDWGDGDIEVEDCQVSYMELNSYTVAWVNSKDDLKLIKDDIDEYFTKEMIINNDTWDN